MTEYTVYDRRDGAEVCRSWQPNVSAKSENAAIREAGIPGQFAEVETRELSPEACRPWVGRRHDDAR